MDPRDLFRGIFGFDKHRFDGSEGNRRKPDRFLDEEDDFEDGSDIDHMFQHFHDEMQKQMEHLNEQMEEMFRHFGATEFPSVIPSLPSPPENPRDSMLKPKDDDEKSGTVPSLPPSEPKFGQKNGPSLFDRLFSVPRFETVQPKDKFDKDLDSEIGGKDLSKILVKPDPKDRASPFDRRPGIFSGHSSVSITTVRGADGKVEQRKTVRDSDGNEETTVTRQIGDKSHTVQTKKDQLGIVEEKETFQNMDKDDLKIFDKDYEDKGRQPMQPWIRMDLPENDPDRLSSIFRKLFGFDFYGKDK